MKIAILADIHGNLEALEAVVKKLDHQKVDEVICLGDNVGYGPDPDGVVKLLRDRNYQSVLGNHEFALFDKRGRRWLNFQAAENNQATEKLLTPSNLLFCKSLPIFLEREDGYFVHGFPANSVFKYLHNQPDSKVEKLFSTSQATVFFVGHTHKLQYVNNHKGKIKRGNLKEGVVSLGPDQKWVISCGSVGQPRGSDNRAKYLLWDTSSREFEVCCVAYDFEKTIEKMKQLNFPEIYGLRLR